MTKLAPTTDFANLTDRGIGELGLGYGKLVFGHSVDSGHTNCDSLAATVGVVGAPIFYEELLDVPAGQLLEAVAELTQFEDWTRLATEYFGPDAKQFEENIDPIGGKLASALANQMDSIRAFIALGPEGIPEGPQRFTGGVYFIAAVLTRDRGWIFRVFAGAASGVQGHFDQATMYSAITHMAALWAMKMIALYHKPGE